MDVENLSEEMEDSKDIVTLLFRQTHGNIV